MSVRRHQEGCEQHMSTFRALATAGSTGAGPLHHEAGEVRDDLGQALADLQKIMHANPGAAWQSAYVLGTHPAGPSTFHGPLLPAT
jgi:hypothetical protein